MSDHATLAVVGSTGSIGTQTLDVVDGSAGRLSVVALGASGRRTDLLIEQARRHRPEVVAVASTERHVHHELERALPDCEVRSGAGALASLAERADITLNAVVGFAGLEVTLATLRAGRRLALANKESLVAGGPVVQEARRTPGAELLPVDSEHASLHQCLAGAGSPRAVRRLVVTASGGPLRTWSAEELEHATLQDALTHPTWQMGAKITIDSSTLANKGLEVIEANELFGEPAGELGAGIALDDIDVVVHPQSIVHAMVELVDGATLAHLSMPDMRLPIAYALGWPDRHALDHEPIDWPTLGSLTFEAPDLDRFPALGLAYAAARTGGTAPAWFNAANEVAVAALLEDSVRWRDVAPIIDATLARHDGALAHDLDAILDADTTARRLATEHVEALRCPV